MSSSSVVCQCQDCRTCIAYQNLLLHRTPCPQWLLISHSLNLWLILTLVGLCQPFQHSTSQLSSFLLIPNSSNFNSERRHLPDTGGHGERRKENQLQFLGKSKQVKTFLRAWSRCPQDSWNNVSTHHMRLSWKELEGTGALRTAAQWCVSALDAVGFQDAKEKIKPPGYRQRVSIYLSERMSCLLPPARHGPWLSGVTSAQTSQGFGYCRV